MSMTVAKLRSARKYRDYGRDYMRFVFERDGVETWRAILNGHTYASFKQLLANANNPVFDPERELGVPDPDGEFYEVAVEAAWDVWEG